MGNVTIIKGAFAGRTGYARPSRAIGPVNARVFLVIVTLEDGCFMELPIEAVEVCDPVLEAQTAVEVLDRQIAACFQTHPRLGDVVVAGQERHLRTLKQQRHEAVRTLAARRSAAGLPLLVSGAMWMVNQADAGYF